MRIPVSPILLSLGVTLGATLGAGQATAADDVMVVFDGSNSMWGQIDGTAKIEIARDAIGNLTAELDAGTNVGLMAYGHRRRGDCSDIEVVLPPAPLDRDAFLEQIAQITPTGKTPLTDAVEQAAEALSFRDRPATVLLISDGLESCDRDPCALAETLSRTGVDFTAHVVGFGLGADADTASLACIAEETGGRFLAADDAATLSTALSTVGAEVAQTPVAPEPEPEPEPEPGPQVTITAPETVTQGADFALSWDPTGDNPRDYVTIVAMGADDGVSGDYARVGDESEANLTAPADTGLYELRYMPEDEDTPLGRAAIEVVEADVTVSAPETVLAGALFDASWTGTVHPRDYVTIVPMGSDDNVSGSYFRVGGGDGTDDLQAPAETGLYEVRYVLNEGKRVMARTPIEVTEPEMTVSAPETVLAGALFDASWTGTVHPRDYVTIVPMGSDDNVSGSYFRVGGGDGTDDLQAPAETGLYEVRYVLNEGKRVMARTSIEVMEPETTVSAPEQVRIGESLRIEWTGAVHPRDYVTLVPRGSDPDTSGDYQRVGTESQADLAAPDAPGLYEVRDVLNEGKRVLARTPVEVLAEDAQLSTGVTLEAPDTASPGTEIEVSWTGGPDSDDQRITLARGGQAIFTWVIAVGIDGPPPVRLTLPDEPGLYELRYLDVSGQEVLSRKPIQIE